MNAAELPFSAAADRNKDAILDRLSKRLPAAARVLEVASGTGQHAAHFAAAHPAWRWQPSDFEPRALPGIAARCAALSNVAPPLALDVGQPAWPRAIGEVDAVYCANLIHISPWASCAALMAGAARQLADAGLLVLYGPYLVDGEPTAPGNRAFDADLRARDPAWGLRRLAAVQAEAAAAGLDFESRSAMPANNLLLVFRKRPAG